MTEAFLEISGENFDPDAALRKSPLLKYAKIHRKGEKSERVKHRHDDSGIQFWIAGDDDATLEEQIKEALEFLRGEAEEVLRLRNFKGVEVAHIRFGEQWPKGIMAHYPMFPSDLLLVCGELRLDIMLSQYLMEAGKLWPSRHSKRGLRGKRNAAVRKRRKP